MPPAGVALREAKSVGGPVCLRPAFRRLEPAALAFARRRSMERMSGDTTSGTTPASAQLLTLLNAPTVETDDNDAPTASQCCGGGSCSL